MFFLLLIMLSVPAIQQKTGLFHPQQLKGTYTLAKRPVYSDSAWFSGRYQEQYSRFREDSIGFRPDLVRLFNQFDFSLFHIPHAGKIIVGKDDYLFGDMYIESYLGLNFAGKEACENKISMMKKIQEKLWNEKKIFFLVIFTPDKASFYPDKIPARYLRRPHPENSNYSYYAKRCVEEGINTIDFNKWFIQARDTSRYPLYPKTGIHWSCYGAALTADSLSKYLSAKLNTKVPRMVTDKIETDSKARAEDDDIGSVMNLIWNISYPVYAYPQVHFEADSAVSKLSALFIGDSFYWNWYNPGYIRNMFSNEDFWYYDKDVFPQSFTKPVSTGQLVTGEWISKMNVIILIQTNGGYGNPGYGFLDRALDELDMAPVLAIERQIRNSPEWMKLMEVKAREQHRPIESVIKDDARFMAAKSQQQEKTK